MRKHKLFLTAKALEHSARRKKRRSCTQIIAIRTEAPITEAINKAMVDGIAVDIGHELAKIIGVVNR